MKKEDRANKIFEERNWGLRILYDTILEVTSNSSEKENYITITKNLKKICKAEFAGIISINRTKNDGYVKSFVSERDLPLYQEYKKSKIFNEVPNCIMDNIDNLKIGEIIPEYKELLLMFPQGRRCLGEEPNKNNVFFFSLSKYKHGEDIGFVGISSDSKLKLKDIIETFVNMTSIILERTKSNNELVEMNKKFSTLLESSPVGIMLIDDNKNIVEVNSALLELMKIEKNELLGDRCYERFCENEDKLCDKLCSNCLALESENTLLSGDGNKVPVLHSVNRIILNDDVYYLETIVDISELKRMEDEKKILMKRLFQMQKLDSLMTLASGVAHEINTPIQSLTNDIGFVNKSYEKIDKMIGEYKSIIKEHVSDQSVADKLHEEFKFLERKYRYEKIGNMYSKAIVEMHNNLKHISDIVNYVKDFSKMDEVEMHEKDINEMVINFVNIYSHELKGKITVNTLTHPSLPMVKCIPSLIKEAIFELLNNAVDAIDNSDQSNIKPTITIETYMKNQSVGISVSDNGIGIEKDIQDRIFDPFYTTKDVGMGTGQGLTNVFNVVVDKHNGNVYFDSDTGVGTKFFIELPI